MSKIQQIGVLLLLQFCIAASVSGGTPDKSESGREKGIRIQPMLAEGLPIALVYIHLEESTGTPEGDDALKKEIAAALTTQAGDIFRELSVDMEIKKIRALPTLSSARSEQSAMLAISLRKEGFPITFSMWTKRSGSPTGSPGSA